MPQLEDSNTRFKIRNSQIAIAGKTEQAFMTLLPFLAILISVLGLLVSGGAVSFFIKYGTRLTVVERESAENKAKIEKHATDLIQANTQVALVAAALEQIKSTLSELKQDVKQWMNQHGHNHED
jgi:hypothetical protein